MLKDHRQVEQQLDRNALLAVADAGAVMSRELVLDRLFNQIVSQAAGVLDAQGASVLLLCPDKERLIFQTAVGPFSETLIGQEFDARLGLAGQALKTQATAHTGDAQRDDAFFANIDRSTGGMTHALIAAPMLHNDEPVGVVEVLNPNNREDFTKQDKQILGAFANLAASAVQLARRYDRNRKQQSNLPIKTPIIGDSAPIRTVIELCKKVALTNTTVLVHGETGTGKELVVNTIHGLSDRRDKPLIPVNCAALAENLLESELFGHRKGAFTGACEDKVGLFERAHGGTLFLDEIGELGTGLQSKLLRVLEQRQVVRVGDSKPIDCDVRLIAATHRDLRAQVQANRFREDLYYRLHVFAITVPPLRERPGDIPMLVDHFIQYFCSQNRRPMTRVEEGALGELQSHAWPGNVRELRNTIERSLILAGDDPIGVEHLPPMHTGAAGGDHNGSSLAGQERELIVAALQEQQGNLSAAARCLNVTRDLLRYRVRKYDISPDEYRSPYSRG